MSWHIITVAVAQAAGAETRYVARCSCGRYRSSAYSYWGYAERAGAAHAAAKTGGA